MIGADYNPSCYILGSKHLQMDWGQVMGIWQVFFFFFFFFVFLGLFPRHLEVPRLGVESELQLSAYTTATATATPDLRPH